MKRTVKHAWFLKKTMMKKIINNNININNKKTIFVEYTGFFVVYLALAIIHLLLTNK